MARTQVGKKGNGDGPPPPPPVEDREEQLRELLDVLHGVRGGDFSVRLPGHWTGLVGKIADAVNEVVVANEKIAEQLDRVGHVVGKEGKTRQRVRFGRLSGA